MPPVVDGGLAITDYEISYVAKITEFDKVFSKFTRWEERVPSLRTSRWMFRDEPVSNFGFRMTGLRAGVEYTEFRLRCCNLRGWSEWVDMLEGAVSAEQQFQLQQQAKQSAGVTNAAAGVFQLELQPSAVAGSLDMAQSKLSRSNAAAAQKQGQGSDKGAGAVDMSVIHIEQRPHLVSFNGRNKSIFTDEPEAPSPPLFVRCTHTTSTCVHLEWGAPLFDGGSEVVDYIVHYTMLERQVTVSARNVIVEHTHRFNTFSADEYGACGAVTAVIRNLLPDTDVVRVAVCAVNKAGLVSERGLLTVVDGQLVKATAAGVAAVVRTKLASRYAALKREMSEASKSNEAWVETSFFTVRSPSQLTILYFNTALTVTYHLI